MEHFSVAAFDPSGELIGKGQRPLKGLSSKWLAIAEAFMSHHGSNFSSAWDGPLSHIRTKLTSSEGMALVTFWANDEITNSIALLTGLNRMGETSLLKMFVSSLRQVDAVRALATNDEPFAGVFQLQERPLMIVVPWGTAAVSEGDADLIQELSIHVAGAFFLGSKTRGSGA